MKKYTKSELYHHGILGMKWGKRNGPPYPLGASDHSASEKKAGWRKSLDKVDDSKKQKDAFSIKAAGRRALAGVYDLNARTYKKSNKTLSSMNEAARDRQLKLAKEAQELANKKAGEKNERKRRLQEVDPELAKNKTTKRAAYDYHNLTDAHFRGKYHTSKKTFAKRYVKTDGDTYTLGKRKAAAALILIGSMPERTVTTPNGRKIVVSGKRAVAKSIAHDMGKTFIDTNVGYKRAEKKYDRKAEALEAAKKYRDDLQKAGLSHDIVVGEKDGVYVIENRSSKKNKTGTSSSVRYELDGTKIASK